MNQGSRNRVARDIESIPKLKKEICQLSKNFEQLSFVQSLDSFDLNPTTFDLTITYSDRDGNQQTISENLSALSGLSQFKPDIVVDTFSDLASVTGQVLFEFAEVRNPQGTRYLPGSLGGTYYGPGLYYWNGTDWINDKDDIYNGLNDFTVLISNLQADLTQEIADRQNADTILQNNIDAEETARQAADTSLLGQIQSNDNDITDLQNDKRDNTAQKNSIEDDAGDLQLVGDENAPGVNKVYGTNSAGQKGWYDQAAGGDQAFVNESVMYKAFSDNSPSINVPTTYQTLAYKSAVAGTFDNTAFAPVANGVQLLKDLVNVTIMGSHYVVATDGTRISLGTAIALDGVPSNVEGGGYIRVASGHNEDAFGITETFPILSAGTVITVVGKRNGGASTSAAGVENKAFLSVFGFIPDTPGVVLGFPAPIITSISLT